MVPMAADCCLGALRRCGSDALLLHSCGIVAALCCTAVLLPSLFAEPCVAGPAAGSIWQLVALSSELHRALVRAARCHL